MDYVNSITQFHMETYLKKILILFLVSDIDAYNNFLLDVFIYLFSTRGLYKCDFILDENNIFLKTF